MTKKRLKSQGKPELPPDTWSHVVAAIVAIS
jgi:hypothetical protein